MKGSSWKRLQSLLFLLYLVETGRAEVSGQQYQADVEDNDFAEFEEFNDDEPKVAKEPVQEETAKIRVEKPDEDEEEAVVEDEDTEFEHFQDDEEFEGYDGERFPSGKADSQETPKITITKVPLHLRTNWDSFYLEMIMIAGLAVYFISFFTGKAKNQKLANTWFNCQRSLLEENFALVGDDGKQENENPGLMKESENIYTLWCSGRTCCEGMLVELKFLKRQDLLAMIGQMMRPNTDQIHVKVQMNKEDMDSFVFCLGTKKTAAKLSKEMTDINTFCQDRKGGEKFGIPSSFSLLAELGEVTSALLDPKVIAILNKYHDLIDFIHFSDQYSGPKQSDDTAPTKLPEVKKMLIFAFNVPVKGHAARDVMETMKPLMQLVFYYMEKVKRYRLSKEGKAKAEKNRLRVEEAFLKTTHAARAEAAAAKREEKRRQEKERIMQEDDPDKQRKWEEREMRRQMKKHAPKMKQLKVKAL